jgi:hypothetical protein
VEGTSVWTQERARDWWVTNQLARPNPPLESTLRKSLKPLA